MTNPAIISTQLTYLVTTGIMKAFAQASAATKIDQNLLLAIASRESNMGLNLDKNWLGDNGNGIGLMQIDRRYHKQYAANNLPNDHFANVMKGALVLQDNLNRFQGNLKAAVAAYNAGPDDVRLALREGLDPDLFTTGQDYARDVLTRYKIINALAGKGGVSNELKVLIGTTILAGLSGTVYFIQSNSNNSKR